MQWMYLHGYVQDGSVLVDAVDGNAFGNGSVRVEPFYGEDGIMGCELLTSLRTSGGQDLNIEKASRESHALGIADQFDRVTMNNALKRISLIDRDPPPGPFSVNASPDYILSGALKRDVERVFEKGLAFPRGLIIEVLETPISRAYKDADIRHLQCLQANWGVKFYLDDYEAGRPGISSEEENSHYERLEKFGDVLSGVKFDGKFVRAALENENEAKGLESSIKGIRASFPDIVIVAEHVDTFLKAKILFDSYGVDAVQGRDLTPEDHRRFVLRRAAELRHDDMFSEAASTLPTPQMPEVA